MPTTELEWLGSDIVEFNRIVTEHQEWLKPLGDTTDVAAHARKYVLVDLFWQIFHHSLGLHALLVEELYPSAYVVQRAIFEAATAFGYLTMHPDPEREAAIFLAYSHLGTIEHATSPEVVAVGEDYTEQVAEARAALGRMPAHLVSEAKRRRRTKPRTWSGKTLREMGKIGKVTGYGAVYPWLSSEAHYSFVGRNVSIRFPKEGETQATISLGRPVAPEAPQYMANFARRVLHLSFRTMWKLMDGPHIEVGSTNPEEWKSAPSK